MAINTNDYTTRVNFPVLSPLRPLCQDPVRERCEITRSSFIQTTFCTDVQCYGRIVERLPPALHIVTTDSTSGMFAEDYIARVFALLAGIDEDHVCGSTNRTMRPYWAARKGMTELRVRQVSERGGKLRAGMDGDNSHQRRAALSVEKRSEPNVRVFQLIITGVCMIAATQSTSLVGDG